MPSTPTTPSSTPATPSVTPNKGAWCVPKAGTSDVQLQENLDYVCGHGFDCSAIQPGGACFEPTTLLAHATYAMNILYQTAGRNPWDCDFSQTATLSSTNPSKSSYFIYYSLNLFEFHFLINGSDSFVGYDGCNYPGGST